MNVEQYSQRIQLLLNNVQQEHPLIAGRISLSALNLIRARILNEGKDHEGKSFGKYSEKKLPFFYFKNKMLGSGAEKKLEAYRKKNLKQPKSQRGISYKEVRTLNGLQTSHVDLSFTKETLNDISVLETRKQGTKQVLTVIASKGSILKNKTKGTTTSDVTEYLGERYGNFLNVSKDEVELLNKALDQEIQNLINKYLQ